MVQGLGVKGSVGWRKGGHDGVVEAEYVGEVVLTMDESEGCGRSGALDDEALVDGSDVRDLMADVDDDAADGVGGVYLGHGPFEDGESGHVEALEEDLTDAFVGGAREARCDGHDDR